MKKLLCLLILSLGISSFAADELTTVAKVDFNEIKDLLLEAAFANPGNKEFQEKHLEAQKHHDDMMERIMTSQREGKPINPMDFTGSMSSVIGNDKKAIENLARTELILIIEELYPSKYQLVISQSYQDPVLYTTSPIPDLTSNIKQHLLKAKAGK